MANIKPFRAWRYSEDLDKQIESLTSPLFDVINQKQRDKLYENPKNSIHLSVPKGNDPATKAKSTLQNWKLNGTIVQDSAPSFYAYNQYFSLPGSSEIVVRKGFVCMIKIHEWSDDKNEVLRHEDTIPHAVSDRLDLIASTLLNVSPTHGLYTDPKSEVETYIDKVIETPLYENEDYQGVKDVFAPITDPQVIEYIISLMENKKVILADGHHRYQGSLDYMKQCAKNSASDTGDELFRYHMMYLTNTENAGFRIMPTHRLIKDLPMGEVELLDRLTVDFMVKTIENAADINEVIMGKDYAFGLLIGENAYKIRLKPERIESLPNDSPKVLHSLDLYLLHYFFFEKLMGIPRPDQASSSNISYERNFSECIKQVIKGEVSAAIITKEISIDSVKQICYSGHTLPQKSTYFYPKVITGFLFGSIDENES
ncbi:MAG: hypothetical protein ACI8QD_001903 [Cyclobacteriaceae bacterium]|jgi:uncharacterized protein (DUF1015 family)